MFALPGKPRSNYQRLALSILAAPLILAENWNVPHHKCEQIKRSVRRVCPEVFDDGDSSRILLLEMAVGCLGDIVVPRPLVRMVSKRKEGDLRYIYHWQQRGSLRSSLKPRQRRILSGAVRRVLGCTYLNLNQEGVLSFGDAATYILLIKAPDPHEIFLDYAQS